MAHHSRRGLAAAVIVLCLAATLGAEIPSGYYDKASGLADARLKTALHEIINPHRRVSSYSALPEYFRKTDVRPGTEFWWDMYSSMDVPVNITFGRYMNREHSFPKSWWGGSDKVAAYTDLFHLYPAEAKANQAKSNYPLGVVDGTPRFDNDVVRVGTGLQSGGASQVFEPADEYKGDFARTYFYVVTCYQDYTWARNNMWMLLDGDYPTLKPWAVDLLLAWHRADPVSEKEKNRNEAVYEIQSNRNPFIDYPELAEYIWGDRVGETFIPGEEPVPGGNPTLEFPAAGASVEFGRVAEGHEAVRNEFFRGTALTGMLELSVTGNDKSSFILGQTTLGADAVCSASGVYLPITYAPTGTGRHEALLVIQDGGLEGSVAIPLRGECVETPELLAPEALDAEDVGPDGYTAVWNQPSGGSAVDYWNLYVTSWRADGSSSTRTVMAESSPMRVEADSLSVAESYYVTACSLGCESAPSNSVSVDLRAASLDRPTAGNPLRIETVGSAEVIVRCGTTIESLRVVDPLGRVVAVFSKVETGTTIRVPGPGIYLFVARGSLSPIRVAVQ